MKKLLLLVLVSFGFSSIGFSQDFSFEDLMKLRKANFPKFESAAHDKGYKLDHLERTEMCTVFRKGSNVISHCERLYNNCYTCPDHAAVKFETASKEQYEALKKQIESNMKYYGTKVRRYTTQHYVQHTYINDQLIVRIYDIAYRDCSEPYYEIEMTSIFGDHHGCLD